jgi:GntR family transcriptional regulator/MocR family aminotransferase
VQGLDPHDRTIYIGTFTKSLFPGLRIGYMVLPPQLVAPMTVARTLLDGHSAPIPQLTLARFIEGGHFGAMCATMRAVYAERRDVLARLVRKHLADFVEPRVPAGGMQMPCVFIRDIPSARPSNRAPGRNRSPGADGAACVEQAQGRFPHGVRRSRISCAP